jgi:hypothetical protein
MTIPAAVIAFLRRHRSRLHCDECIARKLGLRFIVRVQPVTATLGLTPGFVRKSGVCSECGLTRQVIGVVSTRKARSR